jgi:protein gp37
MTGRTAIQWTHRTWNPTTGCTRVTAGCEHCYAFHLHDQRHASYQRTGGVYADGRRMPVQYAQPFSTVQLLPERLLQPLHIKAPSLKLEGMDWVIVGGESGPHARPMQAAWVRELRDRCLAAQIPFFFKQWGGRTPQAGGRMLDGVIWDELPACQGLSHPVHAEVPS